MTTAMIILEAKADGVILALSDTGTIKATGDRTAVNRWLPIIRENKPGIVAALQETVNDDALSEPAAEGRRQKVLEMLRDTPGIRYAVMVDDPDTDPVIMALGIRDVETCELAIPRAKYDPFLLLDLIERHGADDGAAVIDCLNP